MSISAAMVKKLREETGAGVLESKKALESSGGDFEAAAAALREKGLAKAQKKAGRQTREGVVEVYAHPGNRVGVMVELNCETDFVARNESFQALAHDLALHVAAMAPKYLSSDEMPETELDQLKEDWSTQARDEGKPENVVSKIVEGRLKKFFSETCLLDQPFVKDDDVIVRDLITDAIRMLGENIVVRRIERYELGEDI